MSSNNTTGNREILNITRSATEQVILFKEDGEHYCIVTKGGRLRGQEIGTAKGFHVPLEDLFPRASESFPPTRATHPIADDSFLKSGVEQYDPLSPSSLADSTWLLEREVATFEKLKYHPHPNIVEYRGCLVKDGFVKGLVLKEYPEDLSYVADKVDHAMVLRDVGSAIEHLHSLGIIHNDINPGNVMLPVDLSRAILIDFDSASTEGSLIEPGKKKGTPGFTRLNETVNVSERENDLFGLARIKQWLEDPETVEEKVF